MPAFTCSAPGKIILCGEHAVVYGKPAIALPVFNVSTKCTIIAKPNACDDEPLIIAPNIGLKSPLGCLIEGHPIRVAIQLVLDHFGMDHLPVCEIRIQSTLPTAAGMGSSASTSVALLKALSTFLGHPFNIETLNRTAFEIEKIHHGSPSGIDNTVITYEKAIFFIKGQPVHLLEPAQNVTLVIADSGIKGSTAKAVAQVRQSFQEDSVKYQSLFDQIENVTLSAKKCLESGELSELGILLNENHQILQALGISIAPLDDLVSCALQNGALGAKLSGSGQAEMSLPSHTLTRLIISRHN
jgi:mevalonate kinase